jgi:hypothetical protein
MVADHHADVSDGDDSLGENLRGCKPAIEEVGAVGQRQVLPAPPTARAQERLGVLIIVVIMGIAGRGADGRGDNFTRRQRRAIVDRDDGNAIHVDQHFRLERVRDRDQRTDHEGPEAILFAQVLLPADDDLALVCTQ